MAEIKIYSTGTCPICDKTKALLSKWNIPYDEIRIDQSKEALSEMLGKTEFARTVPQILIKDKWIGGFSELTELHREGSLDDLVQK